VEMVVWENKNVAIKEDYDQAKKYFKDLVLDFETYTQNRGGATAKAGYESANQMADVGNEIRKYIQDIASATAADKEQTAELAANVHKSEKIKDAQIAAMTAQIKMLADTMAVLTKWIENKETNGSGSGNSGGGGSGGGGSGGGGSGGGGGSDPGNRTFRFPRNMGKYCWSHGHHPVRAKHDSHTCTHKKPDHNNNATATNCMGGGNYWPKSNRISPTNQGHIIYKGKSAPN
jgi:hypothetical protein